MISLSTIAAPRISSLTV